VLGVPQEPVRAVALKFQETYPDIKVEYVGLDSGPMESRVRTERQAGQYLWDVRLGGAAGAVGYRLAKEGWMQPLKPALMLPEVLDDSQWLGGFDAGFSDQARRYVYGFVSNLAYFVRVNRALVPESELSSAEQLLDPRWKGKLAMPDPRVQGTSRLALAGLRKELGDEALQALIVSQEMVLTADNRQAAEWVVRGDTRWSLAPARRPSPRLRRRAWCKT
jgi:iron(III) transport system substrate-binding protein